MAPAGIWSRARSTFGDNVRMYGITSYDAGNQNGSFIRKEHVTGRKDGAAGSVNNRVFAF